MNRTIVIGLADAATAGRNQVGPALVQALRRLDPADADLVVFAGDASRLCDRWANTDLVILVDAGAANSATPGRVRRRSLRHPSMTTTLAPGRHAQVVREALALGAAMDRLPSTLLLYSVDSRVGDVHSMAVRAAVGALAAEIADELAAAARRNKRGHLRNHEDFGMTGTINVRR
jgi:hydrogenase maturation protease